NQGKSLFRPSSLSSDARAGPPPRTAISRAISGPVSHVTNVNASSCWSDAAGIDSPQPPTTEAGTGFTGRGAHAILPATFDDAGSSITEATDAHCTPMATSPWDRPVVRRSNAQ